MSTEAHNAIARRCNKRRYDSDPAFRAEKIRKSLEYYYTKTGRRAPRQKVGGKYRNIEAVMKIIREREARA